jgi:hypothetical protein
MDSVTEKKNEYTQAPPTRQKEREDSIGIKHPSLSDPLFLSHLSCLHSSSDVAIYVTVLSFLNPMFVHFTSLLSPEVAFSRPLLYLIDIRINTPFVSVL